MKKTLVPVGNSLGLIIEKPVLDLLNIGRETLLEITTDGRRLVVEPLRRTSSSVAPNSAEREPAHHEPDFGDPALSARLVEQLVSRHRMDNTHFRRLHHARNYENTYEAHRKYCATRPRRFQRGGTNELTARRLYECLGALDGGLGWEQAIEVAVQQQPA